MPEGAHCFAPHACFPLRLANGRARPGAARYLGFTNPDLLELAHAFGWHGVRVERSAELHAALEQAFEAGKPALVVVPIDYRENPKLTERLGDIACPI